MSNKISRSYIRNKVLQTGYFDDTKDLNNYVKIIFLNLNRNNNENGYTEKHHWIPRCYFEFVNIPTDNSKLNLVNLLKKDHALAHYYLAKSCNDPELFIKLQKPIKMILNTKKFLSKKEFQEMQNFFRDKIIDLQTIYDRLLRIRKIKDREFYDKTNLLIKKGKTFIQIDKEHNQINDFTGRTYRKICKRQKLINLADQIKKLKDKEFYDFCNKFLEQGLGFTAIDKKIKCKSGNSRSLYWQICLRNNWSNKCNVPKTNEQLDKKFYNDVNALLKQGYSYPQIDEKLFDGLRRTGVKYQIICKRYNLENLNQKKSNKEEDMKFYSNVNKLLNLGKTFNEIDKIMGLTKSGSNSRYHRISKKYNLPLIRESKNISINKIHKDKDILFYEKTNTLLMKGKSFLQIDKENNRVRGYTCHKYLRICKRYNLANKNLYFPSKKINKLLDMEMYSKINTLLLQGLKFSDIDLLLKTKNTNQTYWLICKRYKLNNFGRRYYFSKKNDMEFYNKINFYLGQNKTFKEISNILGINLNSLGVKYYRICKRWKLQSKNLNKKQHLAKL